MAEPSADDSDRFSTPVKPQAIPPKKKKTFRIADEGSPPPPSPSSSTQVPRSPTAAEGSPHSYSSLSILAREAKKQQKENPKADYKNGWHFYTNPNESNNGGEASGGRGSSNIHINKQNPSGFGGRYEEPEQEEALLDEGKGGKPNRMTTVNMIFLNSGMLGAQIAWCLEQGFGSPFLLSLGLSAELTSLVWLAGPISGLVTQPLIGAISDSSTSKYRRRYWIVLSTAVMVFSTLALAYADVLGVIFAGWTGEGDWDPRRKQMIKTWSISIAVASFYLLDFAINALQASLRNLLMDVTPAEQLGEATAWQGRMTHIGNILGFTLGFLDLGNWVLFAWLGGGNFRKFCVIIIFVLSGSVWITCATQEEFPPEEDIIARRSRARDIVSNIYNSILHLPKPVRRVCYVQIFAFMSWFPFLFYATAWVAEVMAYENGGIPVDPDQSGRAGSFAMLGYSVVAVVAGTVLPYLAERDRRLLAPDSTQEGEETLEEAEYRRIKELVEEWKAESKRQGRKLKLPTMPFMLRNIWTSALVLFGLLMMATFFVRHVWQATVIVGMVGICWAVACWVPFAIIMEFLKELGDKQAAAEAAALNPAVEAPPTRPGGSIARSQSTPGRMFAASSSDFNNDSIASERTQLLVRRHSMMDTTELVDDMKYEGEGPVASGTILGIHNLSIVFPQFIIAIVASIIFKIVASLGLAAQDPLIHAVGFESGGDGDAGVAWVMRFGGLCAFAAAGICRRVPPTKTEKAMRRRLGEMRENEREETYAEDETNE